MKNLAVTVAAVAAVAHTASIPQTPAVFSLSNFYFGGTPHSVIQNYRFGVTDGSKNAFCSTTSSVTPGLLTFGMTPCNESAWSFSFTYENTTKSTGYFVNVTQEIAPHVNKTASRFYEADQLQMVQDPYSPTGTYYWLHSPYQFDVSVEQKQA